VGKVAWTWGCLLKEGEETTSKSGNRKHPKLPICTREFKTAEERVVDRRKRTHEKRKERNHTLARGGGSGKRN